MKTFNKKSLVAALAGLGALGTAGTSHAVFLNPDGLGQVLIYPYYTVRSTASGPYNSLLSVVNSTSSAKAVKVRFLEGRSSAEVLDFNLFLSAKDVWVAGILPTANGAGVFTPDKSCTIPTVSSNAAAPSEFLNFVYATETPDVGTSLDRTREGYAEIIEMGWLTGTTATNVTHVGGVPACSKVTEAQAAVDIRNPIGGLFGSMTLINVSGGADLAVDAVALDAFRTVGRYDLAGDIKPDLRDAFPSTATVFSNGAAITDTFDTAIDAVSAALMHDHLFNEFVLDSGTRSGTDWVVTMPTKRYYYDAVPPDGTLDMVVNTLFQRNFTNIGACDDVSTGLFDREEFKTAPGFSPPPRAGVNAVCWEANVITFNNSNVLASKNSLNIATTFQNGWLDLGFPIPATSDGDDPHQLFSTGAAHQYVGLPVLGFAAITFDNGNLTDGTGAKVMSRYAGNLNHKGTRCVIPPGTLTATATCQP